MLSRLAPIVILVLAACHNASDVASTKLVGSWEMDRKLVDVSGIKGEGKDMEAALNKALADAETKGARLTETFTVDGKWSARAETSGEPMIASSTWTVIEEAQDRVKVRIAEWKPQLGTVDRTFVFESTNTMREEAPQQPGIVRYNRVTAK